jgi:tyrosyl-tRNA synthetase
MEIKKSLARLIVADFHSPEAADKAASDWAKQFQKDEVPSTTELVRVPLQKVTAVGTKDILNVNSYFPLDDPKLPNVRLVWFDKVLVEAGLVASRTEGSRKIDAKAVHADGNKILRPLVAIQVNSEKVVRLGKQLKRVSVTE